MKKKTSLCLLAALLVLALLLSACEQSPAAPAAPAESAAPAETAAPEATAEPTPEPTEEPTPEPTEEPAPASPWEVEEPPIEVPEWTSIGVSTVDELLGAIAPETAVVLAPGVYDLTTASDYGRESGSEWYYWDQMYDGYGLVLQNMDGLQILAPEGAEIVTTPRYANVLTLWNCQDPLLAGLTLGHTREPGACSGGVLSLNGCDGARIRSCKLYGCGTCGIDAFNCEDLGVSFTEIYECSFWGLCVDVCREVRMEDCWLHDCGKSMDVYSYQILQVRNTLGFTAMNTRISDNIVYELVNCEDSVDCSLLGCTMENNKVLDSVFFFSGQGALVEDCSFSQQGEYSYYDLSRETLMARDRNGDELISFDLDRMQRQRVDEAQDPDELPLVPEGEENNREVRVSTVDELLEAIAPNTTIILAPGTYDLSEAAGFGDSDGEWYSWEKRYDGPSLSIEGVKQLRLEGAGREETVILAKPRYAAVFGFLNCDGISFSGLTMGHTDEGVCAGNVLDFVGCRSVSVTDCGLFGCGVIGVTGQGCRGIRLENTEIYSCSDGAAEFHRCRNLSMDGCSIHDCKDGRDRIFLYECKLLWNGETINEGLHAFDHEDYLGPVTAD